MKKDNMKIIEKSVSSDIKPSINPYMSIPKRRKIAATLSEKSRKTKKNAIGEKNIMTVCHQSFLNIGAMQPRAKASLQGPI